MQSFFEFLVSVINHYHNNGLHLFLDSFEWFFFLQIISNTNIFFPFLSKTLGLKINSCYSILFSNLKQKRTQRDYLSSDKQSHETHVDWDTLYNVRESVWPFYSRLNSCRHNIKSMDPNNLILIEQYLRTNGRNFNKIHNHRKNWKRYKHKNNHWQKREMDKKSKNMNDVSI